MSWLISRALMKDYENSHSSPGLVAEYSGENCSDGAPSAPSNMTAMPLLYSASGRMTDFCRRSRYGMTCEPLTANLGQDVLTWFLAGFPAKTSAPPEREEESKMVNALASGWKCPGSSVKYDPASSSWKTHQYSLLGGLEPFSATWPRWGSMRNGECWERQTWERRTNGTGYGFWATPQAHDCHKGNPARVGRYGTKHGGRNLNDEVAKWPTPTVCGNYNRKGASAKSGDGLATAVRMVPTPTCNDARNSTLPPSQVDHDNLPGYLLRSGEEAGGQLNPTWVEWLMGWPLGWTDLNALATDKSLPVPPRLSGDCVNE